MPDTMNVKPTVIFTYNDRRYTEGFVIAYSNANSKDAGPYKVTVTGDGEVFSGKKILTYTINLKAQSPSCKVSAVDAGTSKAFEVQKSVGTITATSSNSKVAKVAVAGTDITVTGVAVGTATITIKAAGDTNYKAKSF